jgi:hypothetical protein
VRQILNVLIWLLISGMLLNKRENFFRYQALADADIPADLANATVSTRCGRSKDAARYLATQQEW